MEIENAARALLLVCIASSAAWAVSHVLGRHFSAPLDFGLELPDGRRLLGSHKTWRGLAAGVLACALASPFLELDVATGAGFGAAALLGDALSSTIKRRLALRPGAEVPGLPLALFSRTLGIGAVEITAIALLFTLLDILVAPLRRRR
jgi:CDP-2,3-bis-(O-geranylgeranyl)-sn-glycerol synthase